MLLVPTVTITLPSGSSEQIVCHQLLHQQRQLIVGLSSGTIACFRRRIDSNTLQEQVDSKPQMLVGQTIFRAHSHRVASKTHTEWHLKDPT